MPDSQRGLTRVYVYVDGFNFYLATKWTNAYPYGWCNWRLTAENYCGQSREVVHVKYFTSKIITRDAAKRRRQNLHIAAMKTEGEVILGRFADETPIRLVLKMVVEDDVGNARHSVESSGSLMIHSTTPSSAVQPSC